MTEDNNESHAGGAGGENDFGHLFEQSMRAVRPGEIVKGRVVLVARDHVTVDIGYKSEGQIGIHEFRERERAGAPPRARDRRSGGRPAHDSTRHRGPRPP